MILKVEITQADFNKGLRRSYTLDAVALGLKRAMMEQLKLKKEPKIMIPNLDFGFINGYKFDLPEIARIIIRHHDNQLPVQPQSFELEIPEGLFDDDSDHKLQPA